jgi:AcrR family transcriptional regulator
MATSVGAQKRRARYSEEMRQDILQAAREIIAEEGAAALSIRGIARRIGYSASALYEYYAGKEEIARALFTFGFERLAAVMEAAERAHADPRERIRAMGVAYRQFALAHPQEYSIMFSRPIPEFTPNDTDLNVIASRAFAPLQRAYADGISASELRRMDPRTAATIAWAFIHGMSSLELAKMSGPPPGDYPPDLYIPADLQTIYPTALDLLADAFRNR